MIEFANLLVLAANRESYWKYAYEVCGLELSTKESSTQYKQWNNYCSYVGKLVGEDVNQSILFPLAQCILSLSHGYAVPEKDFSINWKLIEVHRTDLSEGTIEARCISILTV